MGDGSDIAAVGARGVIAIAGAVILAERLTAILSAWDGAGFVFIVTALVSFAAVASVITRRLGRPNQRVAVCVLIGVPIGVLIDATIDSALFSNDRNLFPFEIAFLWIIGSAPALIASVSTEQLDRLLGLGPRRRP